jgi:hypothetical protein
MTNGDTPSAVKQDSTWRQLDGLRLRRDEARCGHAWFEGGGEWG